MDLNLTLLIAVISGVIGGFLYKGLRSKGAGLAGSKLDPNASWDWSFSVPPGFGVQTHETGWTVTSGPKLPFGAIAEIPRLVSGAETGHVRVFVQLALSETVARLFAGPISADWRWNASGWHYPLALEAGWAPLQGPIEPEGLFTIANQRLAQAATLHRLTSRAAHAFFGDDDRLATITTPRTASPEALDRVATTLTDFVAEDERELALRIATHLESPRVWVALLAVRRFAGTATRQLLTRWPDSAEAERAMAQAIAQPHSLDESLLETLFETLERRRDPRLAELLARIVDDVELLHRELVLTWVERCGDETALPGLGVLESRSARQWQSRIEGARAAIAFRRQEVLSRLSGGLSVSVADGSLALSEEDR